MAHFIAYVSNIEMNASLLGPFLGLNIRGGAQRKAIVAQHGIDLDLKEWYPQQQILDCFKAIGESLGDMNLFLIGHATMKAIPVQNINMVQAIEMLNIIYHQSSRLDGKIMYDEVSHTFLPGIGEYKVKSYDEANKKMEVVVSTPFPSKSDEGAVLGVLEPYTPANSTGLK